MNVPALIVDILLIVVVISALMYLTVDYDTPLWLEVLATVVIVALLLSYFLYPTPICPNHC